MKHAAKGAGRVGKPARVIGAKVALGKYIVRRRVEKMDRKSGNHGGGHGEHGEKQI